MARTLTARLGVLWRVYGKGGWGSAAYLRTLMYYLQRFCFASLRPCVGFCTMEANYSANERLNGIKPTARDSMASSEGKIHSESEV